MALWMAKAAVLTGQLPSTTVALVVDQDEVAHADLLEVHAEGVHPEVVGQLRVAGGDVTGDAFVEAELAEQPEAGGQPLLAVAALVVDDSNVGREWGWRSPGRAAAALPLPPRRCWIGSRSTGRSSVAIGNPPWVLTVGSG